MPMEGIATLSTLSALRNCPAPVTLRVKVGLGLRLRVIARVGSACRLQEGYSRVSTPKTSVECEKTGLLPRFLPLIAAAWRPKQSSRATGYA